VKVSRIIRVIDTATKTTLANVNAGNLQPASESQELGGVSRFSPLFVALSDETQLVQAARAQTKLTHNNALVLDAAEYLARVAWRIIYKRLVPSLALKEVLNDTKNEQLVQLINRGLLTATKNEDDETALVSFGQLYSSWLPSFITNAASSVVSTVFPLGKACPIGGALPGVVHFVSKYEKLPNGLEEALIANASVGGDSAARGHLIGLLLGAHFGEASVPGRWFQHLRQREHIVQCVQTIENANTEETK